MRFKIDKKMKLAGISLFSALLLGGLGFYAYESQTSHDQVEESTSLDPTTSNKKSSGVIQDTTPKKASKDKVTNAFKDNETEPYISDSFKSTTGQSYAQEKSRSLSALNNRIREEQTMIQRINNEKEQSKPTQPTQVTQGPQLQGATKPATESTKPTPVPPTKPSEPLPPVVDPPIVNPPIRETDYSVLQALYEQVRSLNQSEYLSSGVESLRSELLISQRMLEEKTTTQAGVDSQAQRLQEAMNRLVKKADKTALIALVEQAKGITTDIYTEETVQHFETAKASAESVIAHSEVNQEQANQAFNALQQAISGLKEKDEPDLSMAYLKRLVAQAEQLDKNNYTATTVANFERVLAEVKAFLLVENTTKEEINQQQTNLQAAIDQLVLKGNTEALQGLVLQAESIERGNYTEESLTALDVALTQARVILLNESATQQEIDSTFNQLQATINQLKEKNDTETTNPKIGTA